MNKEQNQEQRKSASSNQQTQRTNDTSNFNAERRGQQLRTTSSTKNEFKHRESHQGTKNNTIHKDRITNQRPKPIRRRKTINEQRRMKEQITRTITKNSKPKSKTKNKETGTSSTQQNQRTKDNNMQRDPITNQGPNTSSRRKTMNDQKKKKEQNTNTITKNLKQRAR